MFLFECLKHNWNAPHMTGLLRPQFLKGRLKPSANLLHFEWNYYHPSSHSPSFNTNVQNWKRKPKHLDFDDIHKLVCRWTKYVWVKHMLQIRTMELDFRRVGNLQNCEDHSQHCSKNFNPPKIVKITHYIAVRTSIHPKATITKWSTCPDNNSNQHWLPI